LSANGPSAAVPATLEPHDPSGARFGVDVVPSGDAQTGLEGEPTRIDPVMTADAQVWQALVQTVPLVVMAAEPVLPATVELMSTSPGPNMPGASTAEAPVAELPEMVELRTVKKAPR
jgi:hypothetical protein